MRIKFESIYKLLLLMVTACIAVLHIWKFVATLLASHVWDVSCNAFFFFFLLPAVSKMPVPAAVGKLCL